MATIANNNQEIKITKATIKADDKLVSAQSVLVPTLTTSNSSSTAKVVTLSSIANIATQIKKENYVYIIKYDFDLKNATVNVPKNTILYFQGGTFKNGTLVGNNSSINADHKIFDNIKVEGSWTCVGNVLWFVNGIADMNKPTNDYKGLQSALDSSFTELVFPPIKLYTASTLVLSKPKVLQLQGIRMRTPLNWNKNIENTTVIFTDKNIDLLSIDVRDDNKYNAVEIYGGNFDTSFCSNYTKSCIKVLADVNQKLWGVYIKTNITGKYCQENGIGIDLNPIRNDNAKINDAFITNVRIDSDISYFGIGIKAIQWGDNKNWLTDLYIDGNIRFCPCAIDTSVDSTVTASIQSGKFWNEQQNDAALIYVRNNTSMALGSMIYDIYAGDSTNKWSNRYAVIAVDRENGHMGSATIVPFGRFETFLIGAKFHEVSFIKGRAKLPLFKDMYFYGGDKNEKSAILLEYGNEIYNKV